MSRIFAPILTVSALVALVLSTMPATVRAQDATPDSTEMEIVVHRFIEAMNEVFATGDASLLDAVVSSEYVDNTPSPTRTGGEQTPDLAGLKASFEAVHAVFPQATVTVDDTIIDGEMAAVLVTFNGLRGPDTEVDGVMIFRVADSQVVESWNYERGGEARLQPMFEATPET